MKNNWLIKFLRQPDASPEDEAWHQIRVAVAVVAVFMFIKVVA